MQLYAEGEKGSIAQNWCSPVNLALQPVLCNLGEKSGRGEKYLYLRTLLSRLSSPAFLLILLKLRPKRRPARAYRAAIFSEKSLTWSVNDRASLSVIGPGADLYSWSSIELTGWTSRVLELMNTSSAAHIFSTVTSHCLIDTPVLDAISSR